MSKNKQNKQGKRKKKQEAEVTGSVEFTLTQSKHSIYLNILHTGEVMEFENSPTGLEECYQIISEGLGLDAEEDEVLPFRRAARPIFGVNHRRQQ